MRRGRSDSRSRRNYGNASRRRRRRSRSSRGRSSSRRRRQSSRQPSRRSSTGSASNEDDPSLPGIVRYRRGDVIDNRFKILKLAGQGTFGTALYVRDLRRGEEVAMKVIRSVDKYLKEAKIEIEILTRLAEADTGRSSGIVRLHEHFTARIRGKRHVCIIFEKLSKSLWDVLERNNCRGFTLAQVREFGRQLFRAVGFCHKQKLTHTDLKPENILLCDDVLETPDGRGWQIASTETRLIDFGGATFHDDHHSSMINTRQYRAPEVMLGLGWSYPSDIWSCGCVLPELLTGSPLFSAHRNLEHFALMKKILGRELERTMAQKALDMYTASGCRGKSSDSSQERGGRSPSTVAIDRLLDSSGRLRWPGRAKASTVARVERAKLLEEQFDDRWFVDLLQRCLVYDPSRRITADEALRHPFFESS
eukprot:TRINITY_DN72702_c0_g1_i1.p1 TRINITY_DN72702_c0_g1~~TRINITY_DN72702_c0_g1_i1.p1  ORF type:complete len:421 (+),score=53.12 TRINITY_DN72702_c0_g1_i1:26-1288(+)